MNRYNYILSLVVIICFFSNYCKGQQITGKVVGRDSTGIPGITVVKKGTNVGTITDSQGKFSINAVAGDKLVFSTVGFTNKEIEVENGRSIYNLLLDDNGDLLSEVVVVGHVVRSQLESTINEARDFNLSLETRVDSVALAVSNSTSSSPTSPAIPLNSNAQIRAIKKAYHETVDVAKEKRQRSYIALSQLPTPLPNEELTKKIEEIESIFRKSITDAERLFNQKIDIILRAFNRVFLPANNSFTASRFYGSPLLTTFDFINNTSLSANFENGAFANEIVASYLSVFRVSLNTILSKQKQFQVDNTKIGDLDQKQLQKLIKSADSSNRANSTLMKVAAGGGEFGINFKTPIIDGISNRDHRPFSGFVEVLGNITTDLPIAGSYIGKDSASVFYMAQAQGKGIVRPNNFSGTSRTPSDFYFFGIINVSFIGGTKSFYENLSIPVGKKFWMTTITAGINFKQFSIFYTRQDFSISELKDKISTSRIGLTLLNIL